MLGYDAQRGHGVKEHGGGLGEGNHNRGVISGLRLLQEGQIHRGLRSLGSLQRKHHIGGRHRLAIGELRVIAQFEGPDQATFIQRVFRSQIIGKAHIGIILNQGALHQRNSSMAPTLAGIQRGGLNGDGNDHLVGVCFRGGCILLVICTTACEQAQAQYSCQ